jgi:YbbR domain-containing protein
MIRHNLGLKILSVLISFALWFYVTYPDASNPFEYRQFALNVYGLDTDAYKYKILPGPSVDLKDPKKGPFVIVKMQGPPEALKLLNQYNEDQFNAELSLANATPGVNKYRVDLNPLPQKIEGLVFSRPAPIDVEIVPIVPGQKKVEVECMHVPAGFEVVDSSVLPASITVDGAKEDVDRIKRAAVLVDLKFDQSKKDFNANVDLYDSDGKPVSTVQPIPNSVQVHVVLGVATEKTKLLVSPQWGRALRHGYTIRDISCDPSMVSASGKSKAVQSVHVIETEPIDLSNVTSDRILKVHLKSPGHGIVLSAKTVDVRIRVSRPPIEPAPVPAPTVVTPPPTTQPSTSKAPTIH